MSTKKLKVEDLNPVDDVVLVLPNAKELESDKGLKLPASAVEKSNVGTVVAVGPGKSGPLSVNEKDIVVFMKHAGFEIEIDKKMYISLRYSDIIYVVKKDD